MKARANELAARLGEDVTAADGKHADRRRDFPRRPEESSWPASMLSVQQIIALIDAPPFRPANGTGYRRYGTAKILEWLASFPGDSWQQRWKASGAEGLPKEQWLDLPMQWRQATGRSLAPHNRDAFQTGLLMLVCAGRHPPVPALDGPQGIEPDRPGDARVPRPPGLRAAPGSHRR